MRKVISILVVLALVMGLTIGTVGAATGPYWDISGTWLLDFAGGTANREFVDLIQYEDGYVEGDFWWLDGSIWKLGGNLKGYVSGNNIALHYDRVGVVNTGYEGDFTGIISITGMAGRFTDTSGNDLAWVTVGEPICLLDDAPAVAVKLLKDADIKHRYGEGKEGGNHIADVAHEMADDGSFHGISKCDAFDYMLAIAKFLNEKPNPAMVSIPSNEVVSVVLFDVNDDGAFGTPGDSLTIEFLGSVIPSGDTPNFEVWFTNVGWGIYSYGAITDWVINDNEVVFTVSSQFTNPRMISGEQMITITGLEDVIGNTVVIPGGAIAVTE